MRHWQWVRIGFAVLAWLALGALSHAADREETGELADGDATLTSGEFVDKYTFTASAGKSFVIDLYSEDFDTYLFVTGIEDARFQVDNNDFEQSTSRSQIQMTAAVNGTYVVHVTSNKAGETGAYRLTIGPPAASPDEAVRRREEGELADGDATRDKGQFADSYLLEAVAGESFVIDLSSEDFDPFLLVRGIEDSAFEAVNDDFQGSASRSQIWMTARVSGTYEIAASSYRGGETGGYRLTISEPPQPSGEPVRREEQGELAAGDETLTSGEFEDEYTLEATAGESFVIDLTSEDFDTYLFVRGVEDSKFGVDNNDFENSTGRSQIGLTALVTGAYEISVTSNKAGETGVYRLTISELPTGEPVRRKEQGELAEGDDTLRDGEFADAYTLVATAGQAFVIDLTSEDFDTYLIVRGVEDSDFVVDNNDFEGSTSRSQIGMMAQVSGTYTVYVTSNKAGETGRYRLTISSARSSHDETADLEAELTAALERDPEDKSALGGRAALRYEAGRYEEALDDYDRLLALQPEPYSFVNRGKCHEALEQLDEAIADYSAALARLPAPLFFPEIHLRRGLCYVQTEQWAEALADLEKLEPVLQTLPEEERPKVEAGLARARREVGQSGPPDTTEAEAIEADTCVVRVRTVADATVFVDGRSSGNQREFTFDNLVAGRQDVAQIRVRFPQGGEAQRVAIVQGGRNVEVAAMQPTRIVFAFDRRDDTPQQIYSVNTDGSDFRRLVRSSAEDYAPVLSADGSWIAFLRSRESTADLYVVNAVGGEERLIAPDVAGLPAWSPDCRRIAFTSGEEVRIADVNGSGSRYLADGAAPAWSPDGRRIAFHIGTRDDLGQQVQTVWIVDESGANLQQLTWGSYPRWSPDGSQLTFLREGVLDELYVIGVDGTAETRLSELAWGDYCWSPDSRRIAFFEGDLDIFTGEVYGEMVVVNRDGSGRHTVFESGAQSSRPDAELWFDSGTTWSPDGSQLAFDCSPEGWFVEEDLGDIDSYIYVVNADGADLKPLVRYQGRTSGPCWR